MQIASSSRKLSRVLRAPFLIRPEHFLLSSTQNLEEAHCTPQWQNQRNFSSQIPNLSGNACRDQLLEITSCRRLMCSMMQRASFASESEASDTLGSPTEAVKEIYDKMLDSVKNKRSMPPNALMWSLIEKCAIREDIALLFQMLQTLRTFRLSNLRIHSNFNSSLCLRVAEACARVGAIDFGKKALWEHNVYGLTPTVGSANYLLLYAKEHNDTKLMVDIMKLLQRNHCALQPSTADIVFSICYNTDNWELLSKYAKKFSKAGVKLRRTTYGTWMQFAAKRGDLADLWKIEKQRSDLMDKHCLATGFACAKGFLLESKPENATAVIHLLNEKLSDAKRPGILVELEKLVSEWPKEVLKYAKEGDRKALASSLKTDITAMIDSLLNLGVEAKVNLDDLNMKEAIPC